jgi:hypothetical protein
VLLAEKLMHDDFAERGIIAAINLLTLDEYLNALKDFKVTTVIE